MRTTKYAIIGVGVLLAAGCSHAERHARTAGQHATLGRKAQATPSPAPPPARKIDCDRVKCVALTFDDGPGPYTARLLDTLKKDGVRATFFMLGENVGAHRDVVRRMALEGQEVANHSWSHPDLTTLSTAEVRSQIQRTQKVIKDASGMAPTLVRPPYGSTNKRVGHAVGMPLILWSVDTLDWRYRNVTRDTRVGIKDPEAGGIVLFHDIHKPSVDSIPKVVEGLKKRGFTFVTVSELFGGERLTGGQTYTERVTKPAQVNANPPPSGSPAGSPAGPTPGSTAPGSTAPASPAPTSPGPVSPGPVGPSPASSAG
ncbi:polysaccharide deacetylase family protein [Actinomadura darangshiensis]|uniref:polysaccharide deacetylase family protein n=1 Tax=Actinomadura darangshiensis TaxID=705336 RepID=UPI001FB6BBC8|nr:polysaccharide deacetylase family protein [Actinomadura darangshiensis]